MAVRKATAVTYSKAFDTAKEYYPKYWGIDKLVALVKAGKMTEAEYKELTGFVYPNTEAVEESTEETPVEETPAEDNAEATE